MRTDSPGCQLDPLRVTLAPGAYSALLLRIVCAGNVLALGLAMSDWSPWIAGAGDVLARELPCGLVLGSAVSAFSLWLVQNAGKMLPLRSVISAITIAGAASSAAQATSRSVNLLLSFKSLPLVLMHTLLTNWRSLLLLLLVMFPTFASL